MPKDPTRNIPNYKIDGDHLNEYEFEQNKGKIKDDLKHSEKKNNPAENENKTEESNTQKAS